MSIYETIAIPFKMQGNRQYLTRQQIENSPYLTDFIEQFPHCFEADPVYDVYWYYPKGRPHG